MWRKNSRYLGVIALVLILVSINCISVKALRINEINAMGKEYVEIYNDMGEINLDEWFIKDSSTNAPDEIICTDIPNCFLNTSAKYFLILGRSTNIREITQEEVVYFYTDDQKIGNGLNDGGDDISFYKNGFESWYKYEKAETNKSRQFCESGWILEPPTPGKENSCQEEQGSQEEDNQEETSKNESEEIVKEKESSSHSTETIYVTGNVVGDNVEQEQSNELVNETKEVIYLNNKNVDNVIYESKTEKIKKLSIVLLGLLGIITAFVLIRWKVR